MGWANRRQLSFDCTPDEEPMKRLTANSSPNDILSTFPPPIR